MIGIVNDGTTAEPTHASTAEIKFSDDTPNYVKEYRSECLEKRQFINGKLILKL